MLPPGGSNEEAERQLRALLNIQPAVPGSNASCPPTGLPAAMESLAILDAPPRPGLPNAVGTPWGSSDQANAAFAPQRIGGTLPSVHGTSGFSALGTLPMPKQQFLNVPTRAQPQRTLPRLHN